MNKISFKDLIWSLLMMVFQYKIKKIKLAEIVVRYNGGYGILMYLEILVVIYSGLKLIVYE